MKRKIISVIFLLLFICCHINIYSLKTIAESSLEETDSEIIEDTSEVIESISEIETEVEIEFTESTETESFYEGLTEPSNTFEYYDETIPESEFFDFGEDMSEEYDFPEIEEPIEYNFDNDSSSIIDDNNIEITTEHIFVKNIELAEFTQEMYVNDTQTLSPTILPADATNQNVSYSSSNNSVATISQIGKITAIGKGSCKIFIEADGFSTYYNLEVKVKTTNINVKSNFVVLKLGEQFSLEGSVTPKEAPQELTYKSKNEEVATVDKTGTIFSHKIGDTMITVSNEDTTVMINVIVSADENLIESIDNSNTKIQENDNLNSIVKKIKNSPEDTVVTKDITKISKEILRELHETEKNLIIECDDYNIYLNGKWIINATNEIDTKIIFIEKDNGLEFEISDNLPGKIELQFKNKLLNYNYLYFYDNEKYSILNTNSTEKVLIDTSGKYYLKKDKIGGFKINFLWIIGGIGVILTFFVIYIFTKKKYWFW